MADEPTQVAAETKQPEDRRDRRDRDEDKVWWRASMCWFALRLSDLWDFVDRRQLDVWGVTIFTLGVTWKLTELDIELARMWMLPDNKRDGMQLAAVFASINIPWGALQAAAVKFVFDVRQKSFLSTEK